jgi:hypothetical protein
LFVLPALIYPNKATPEAVGPESVQKGVMQVYGIFFCFLVWGVLEICGVVLRGTSFCTITELHTRP